MTLVKCILQYLSFSPLKHNLEIILMAIQFINTMMIFGLKSKNIKEDSYFWIIPSVPDKKNKFNLILSSEDFTH